MLEDAVKEADASHASNALQGEGSSLCPYACVVPGVVPSVCGCKLSERRVVIRFQFGPWACAHPRTCRSVENEPGKDKRLPCDDSFGQAYERVSK